MANSNGKIVAPVDIKEDIYKVLGIGARTLSDGKTGYLISYACMNEHEKINKWSKIKPIRLSKGFNLTLDDRKNTHLVPASGGTEIHTPFGVRPPKSPTRFLRDIALVDYNTAKNYYIYYPPTSSDPHRFADFNGYYHNAEAPFTCGLSGDSDEFNVFDTAVLRFGCSETQVSADNNFKIRDFYSNVYDNTNLYVVFTVEFYARVQSGSNFVLDSKPYYWIASPVDFTAKSGGAYNYMANIEVTIAELRTAYNKKYTASNNLGGYAVVCFGLNRLIGTGVTKFNNNKTKNHFELDPNADDVDWASTYGGQAMVAPVTSTDPNTALRVMNRTITFSDLFSYDLTLISYWSPNISGSAGSWAINTATTVVSPDLGIEVSLKNTGTQTIRVISNSGQWQNTNDLMFRARAYGRFTNNSSNNDPCYNTPYEGQMIVARARATVSNSSSASIVSIASNATVTFGLYFTSAGMVGASILPLGLTQSFAIEVSSDGGNTWRIATTSSAQITRRT